MKLLLCEVPVTVVGANVTVIVWSSRGGNVLLHLLVGVKLPNLSVLLFDEVGQGHTTKLGPQWDVHRLCR